MSIERSVKKAARRQEYDRIQWAAPDKIDYKVQAFMCFEMVFDLALNFDGVVLKGYAPIHAIASYEHPLTVIVPTSGVSAGEVLTGPYWFGRAFDAPPFFTFSAVLRSETVGPYQITVGVAEWHQDEQDIYIGATLWIKVLCFPLACC